MNKKKDNTKETKAATTAITQIIIFKVYRICLELVALHCLIGCLKAWSNLSPKYPTYIDGIWYDTINYDEIYYDEQYYNEKK